MRFYSCDICGNLIENQNLEICVVCKNKICKDCFAKSGGYCRCCNTKIWAKNLTKIKE